MGGKIIFMCPCIPYFIRVIFDHIKQREWHENDLTIQMGDSLPGAKSPDLFVFA
jgi:hypothetical protein